jgi:hypothetical protein
LSEKVTILAIGTSPLSWYHSISFIICKDQVVLFVYCTSSLKCYLQEGRKGPCLPYASIASAPSSKHNKNSTPVWEISSMWGLWWSLGLIHWDPEVGWADLSV